MKKIPLFAEKIYADAQRGIKWAQVGFMIEENTYKALRLNVGLEREAIVKMATAAGFAHSPPPFKHWRGTISDLERFAALVIEASTRERSNESS